MQCLITGIVFSKLSRPKSRAQTLLFSRYAVISLRDGAYCLQFRVGDVRGRSHIVGTALRAVLVRNRLTREGESIPLCQYPISVQTSEDATADLSSESSPTAASLDAETLTEKAVIGNGNEATTSVTSGDQYLFLVWPVTIVHRIDERSPFWDVSAEQVRRPVYCEVSLLHRQKDSVYRFTAIAGRKAIAVQRILKHVKSCTYPIANSAVLASV
jgi:potassium inwardly-rectifying channel subfamily J, other